MRVTSKIDATVLVGAEYVFTGGFQVVEMLLKEEVLSLTEILVDGYVLGQAPNPPSPATAGAQRLSGHLCRDGEGCV